MRNPMQSAFELYVAQLQTSKTLLDALISGAERMDHIALQAVKEGMHTQIANAEAIAAAKDLPSALVAMQANAQPSYERTAFRYREMLRAISDTYAAMIAAAQAPGSDQDRDRATPEGAVPNPLAAAFEFWNAAWRQSNAMTQQFAAAAKRDTEEKQNATQEVQAAAEKGTKRKSG